jgi:hypothetical protein
MHETGDRTPGADADSAELGHRLLLRFARRSLLHMWRVRHVSTR